MKRYLLLSLALSGCITGSAGAEYQTEIALHKMRSEIDEIKHDIHTHQLELSVLEGKSQSNEETLLTMRKEGLGTEAAKLEKTQSILAQLHQKISLVEKKQEEVEKHLQTVAHHNQEMQKALAQYREKIGEIERNISLHNQTIAEMAKVKDHLRTLSEIAISQGTMEVEGRHFLPYRVKSGDTLDKIAKEHRTSAEMLRKINHMNNDLILAGQDLLVPKKTD
ncbi:MAG: LysM peptidoglycan-binding domain-containing protein [Chlamydiae bacterium]|nr:LysM peptidoglycan-binding domain-containing protein [Chlamydiota bacterium]